MLQRSCTTAGPTAHLVDGDNETRVILGRYDRRIARSSKAPTAASNLTNSTIKAHRYNQQLQVCAGRDTWRKFNDRGKNAVGDWCYEGHHKTAESCNTHPNPPSNSDSTAISISQSISNSRENSFRRLFGELSSKTNTKYKFNKTATTIVAIIGGDCIEVHCNVLQHKLNEIVYTEGSFMVRFLERAVHCVLPVPCKIQAALGMLDLDFVMEP
eukprot:scaffold2717_cov89-Cylindrotheca_fusiformis.AAC.3